MLTGSKGAHKQQISYVIIPRFAYPAPASNAGPRFMDCRIKNYPVPNALELLSRIPGKPIKTMMRMQDVGEIYEISRFPNDYFKTKL